MSVRRPSALGALSWFLAAVTLSGPLLGAPSIRWIPDPADPARAAVEVGGLDPEAVQKLGRAGLTAAQWHWVLAVYAESGRVPNDPGLPPMHGTYRIQAGGIRFEPQFPLAPGASYRAVFRPAKQAAAEGECLTANHRGPAPIARATTVVSHVYPSAATLPENLLRFYVHFSAPMSRGRVYDFIQLLDESGRAVELPFLELDEELWNPAMTRLTLLIDPGRIKRGVLPLEEIGPALEAGKRFRLVIDPQWKDAEGNRLAHGFEKAFLTGPPEREPLDAAQWKIEPPASGTCAPLVVWFPKPLDHGIARRVIRVIDAAGVPVDGTAELTGEERRWSFVPSTPWVRAALELVVPHGIEDVAGNNIGKSFDVDLHAPAQLPPAVASTRLSFKIP